MNIKGNVYRINWMYFSLFAIIPIILIAAIVHSIQHHGFEITDTWQLFFCVVLLYVFIASCWGTTTIDRDNIILWNSLFRQKITVPFNNITKVERSFFLCAFQYIIHFNIDGRDRVEFANALFRWKDMLRQISTKVDKRVFDDDVKKKLGLN
jgi:hypothetical protein